MIPRDTFKTTYTGLLKGLLQAYITGYNNYMHTLNPEYIIDSENPKAIVIDELKNTVIKSYLDSTVISGTVETMARAMTEALMKKTVLTKIGELTANLTNSFATAFNVDEEKIASAFTLNFTEDELSRVVNAMMNPTEKNQKSNLISLGYQDKDEPTYISFYFNSFDGKEHFLSFIDDYNKNVDSEQEIKYSDTGSGVDLNEIWCRKSAQEGWTKAIETSTGTASLLITSA